MTWPMLLALFSAAVLGWTVEAWPVMSHHGPNQHLESRDELVVVEPRQFRGPSYRFLPSIATTTTTLTLSVPEPTSPPSLTPTGLPEAASSSISLPTHLPTLPPDADGSRSWSTVDRQTSSEALVTDTMPTDTTTSPGPPPTTDISASSNDGGSGIGSNRTLIITLSTVFSVVGLALIAGVVWFCWRRRQRRLPLLSRGITPIGDDEIERWKSPREKTRFHGGDTDVEADAAFDKETGVQSHAKHPSTSSVKKPPSVIVYNRAHDNQGIRHSTDAESRRSFAQNHPAYSGRTSFDKALPQTPIQARAPNARAGLTDESVPGDEPFLPGPKRSASRLSKLPPNSAKGRRARHARARSSRSSTRSFGEYYYYESRGGSRSRAGSDLELSPRHSHDHVRHSHHHSMNYGAHRGSHSRVYSSSSIPPRLSFGDEMFLGGLSPARPRFTGEGEIGRAIG